MRERKSSVVLRQLRLAHFLTHGLPHSALGMRPAVFFALQYASRTIHACGLASRGIALHDAWRCVLCRVTRALDEVCGRVLEAVLMNATPATAQ